MLYSFLLIGFDLLNIAVRIFAFIPMLADDAPSLSGEYHTETSCLIRPVAVPLEACSRASKST